MIAEELIIGHFEHALDPLQEAELQQMLASQPDIRALYEHHEALEGMLANDVASLAPSVALDNHVVKLALGTAAEITGETTGFWFIGKIAAVVSAIVVGGVSIAVLSTSHPTQSLQVAPYAPVPMVKTVPVPTSVSVPEATTSVNTNAPAISKPRAAQSVESSVLLEGSKPKIVSAPVKPDSSPGTIMIIGGDTTVVPSSVKVKQENN